MKRSRKRKLLILVTALLAAMVAAVALAPLALNDKRVHAALQRRLSAAFGRPVEAGDFKLGFAGRLRLEAENVSVAEDARFGYEDFLRAERLTAGVRWQALLAGRLEFGTLLLTRPSFNVVRAADGAWNLRTWLPSVAAIADSKGDPRVAPTKDGARQARVEIDGGRINFKRGVDKHPFALTGVEGFLERLADGAWQVDLRAVPMRAGIVVQEPGIVRVRGVVRSPAPGASPAELSVQWADASISDALRLAVGHDYGVRGGASLEAQIRWPAAGPVEVAANKKPEAHPVEEGSLALAVRLAGVHRWDLPSRAADPALNLSVQAGWMLPLFVEVKSGVLEAPGSNVRFSGIVSPTGFPTGEADPHPYKAKGGAPASQPPSSLRVVSSAISLNDLFCWYRAFRPGVSDAITVEGHTGIDLEIRGWPPRLERAVMASDGAAVRTNPQAAPGDTLTMGRAELRFTRDARTQATGIELKPVTLTFGDPRRESAASSVRSGTLRVDAVLTPSKNWQAEWNVAGQTARAQQWWAAAGALGVPHLAAWAANGWAVQGPAVLRLRWQGTAWPLDVSPSGTVDLSGAALHAGFLNQPVRMGIARVEFAGGERRVSFSNTQAFGTAWSGTLRGRIGQPWEIAVAAERLDAAQLDRWLNPAAAQGAPGILSRLATGSGAVRELPAGLRASGRVSVAQFTLGALVLRRLRGDVSLESGAAWRVNLNSAQADFFGGAVDGNFTAEYAAAGAAHPAYRAEVNLTGVNLAMLVAASPRTAGLFDGQLAGRVNISAAGVGRDALLGSLGASGAVQIRNARTRLMDLPASLRLGRLRRGSSEFSMAAGEFGLDAERKLQIASLRLTLPGRSPVLTSVGGRATIQLSEDRPLAVNQLDVSGNVEWFGVPETRLNFDVFVPDVPRNGLAANGARRSGGRGSIFNLRGTLGAPQIAPGAAAGKQ